jgi:hypothetical protein
MASREKKSPSTRKKRFHLSEIDLARAAAASDYQKRTLIKAATDGRGYPFYKGFRLNLSMILRVPLNSFVPAAPVTKRQILAAIVRACNDAAGEVEGNKSLGEGFMDYVTAHNVMGAEFNFDSVALGRAGRRKFWEPFILKIDGKKYIPFFDPRRDDGLTAEARRLIFSINHTYIRLANPTEFADVGFVIFQFEDTREKARKVIAHFYNGISFWTDQEIGTMIDKTYRVLDEVRRAA